MQRPPQSARNAAAKDSRIVEIHEFPDGWVPKSYNWPTSGRRLVYRRNGSRQWALHRIDAIDRKRRHGGGPDWVCRSASGGSLAIQ